MTEGEEMTWARRKQYIDRFDEVMHNEGEAILPPSDARVKRVARVSSALITALEEENKTLIYGATWPPSTTSRVNELTKVMHERERGGKFYPPSATAKNSFVPYRHDAGDPLLDLDREDWNIYVIEGSKINAFALPSKEIFVYSGLVDLVDDDTLLSGILAHEIAHVTQRHAVENLGVCVSFEKWVSAQITDSAAVFINWLNDVVAERAYSRKLEMEADAVGLNFMASAGYDPRAALDLWDLMAAVEADAAAQGRPVSIEDRLSFLQTHPTSQVRQEALARLLPNAMKIYKESQARRKVVPIKTESVTATIDTTSAASTKAQKGSTRALAKATAPIPNSDGKKETALYTTSPAIAREAITPEKTRRVEEVTDELGKERERMYARWGEGQGSVRLV
ncbi:hypothetical protein QFC24_006577 [Naganishia onofrii]|uniref:Uncharacterized protein n=1 Tax=Naganishia onofrii TaxID=1851511 RepID=A0ACC2X044_9TREE|nr:hypothetical protein QFC24_006577 [Naganishia onofrii]